MGISKSLARFRNRGTGNFMTALAKFSSEEKAAMDDMIRRSGSNDVKVALEAQREIAFAAQGPIRQGILADDTIGNIFTPFEFTPGVPIEYPLDFLVPGTESEYTAYTIPNHGRIPERHVEGDMVTISTYDVGSSIDWLLKFARNARWDIVGRGLAVLQATFTRKRNIDAWHTLIAAGVDRNIVIYDSAATAGFFTKRLISLMKLSMRRLGGGDFTTVNPINLTDLWISPEGVEDVRSWDLTMVDDVTRREIFVAEDEALTSIFGVVLHETNELGEGQLWQKYFLSLGGTFTGGDLELVIGMDMTNPDVFVNPITQQIEIFEDEGLHRQRRQGYYGWGEHGFGVLDNRYILLGAF
jgi:hypothetical protein